jgi:hypothetical protein
MLNIFQTFSMFLTFTLHIVENIFTHTPICASISTYHIQHKNVNYFPNTTHKHEILESSHVPKSWHSNKLLHKWESCLMGSKHPLYSTTCFIHVNKAFQQINQIQKSHIKIGSLTHLLLLNATRFVVYIQIATKVDRVGLSSISICVALVENISMCVVCPCQHFMSYHIKSNKPHLWVRIVMLIENTLMCDVCPCQHFTCP